MSVNAHIDQNDVKTWTAWNEGLAGGGGIDNVYIDPATNALLVYVASTDANTPTTLNNAKIDANDVKTLLGYNETTGLVEALRCGVNGELLINIA
jgi:hypothetical protein